MSTRATIAVRRAAGDFLATYLHFDGYPEHAGRLLEANYLNAEEAETLVAGGDIRCLDAEIGDPEYYPEECPPPAIPTREALVDFAKNCRARFVYVFEDGAWFKMEL